MKNTKFQCNKCKNNPINPSLSPSQEINPISQIMSKFKTNCVQDQNKFHLGQNKFCPSPKTFNAIQIKIQKQCPHILLIKKKYIYIKENMYTQIKLQQVSYLSTIISNLFSFYNIFYLFCFYNIFHHLQFCRYCLFNFCILLMYKFSFPNQLYNFHLKTFCLFTLAFGLISFKK